MLHWTTPSLLCNHLRVLGDDDLYFGQQECWWSPWQISITGSQPVRSDKISGYRTFYVNGMVCHHHHVWPQRTDPILPHFYPVLEGWQTCLSSNYHWPIWLCALSTSDPLWQRSIIVSVWANHLGDQRGLGESQIRLQNFQPDLCFDSQWDGDYTDY